MSLLEHLSTRSKAFLFFFAALAVAGGFAGFKLPVALFPQVSFPRIVVSIEAGDRPADQMLANITIPTEEAMRALPGVVNVRSKTSRGSAELSLDFGWGDDMTSALLLVETATSRIAPELPKSTRFRVRRMDPTVFPIVALSLVSDKEPMTRLWERANFVLRPELLGIEGVARVEVIGGAREELQILVQPLVLAANRLTMAEVEAAVASWSDVLALGRVEDFYRLDLILTAPEVTNVRDLEALVLRSDELSTLRLGDVATIQLAPEPTWTRVTANGRQAVLVQVYQQPSGNTVAISDAVKQALLGLRSSLPESDVVSVWYDQSDLIKASAASVRDAVLIGTLLAGLVLLAFLRSIKITLIAVVVVPSVLAATCLLLEVLGQSLNIMTLGGMAAAVGLIIDDTIVVVEHVVSRLRGAGSTATGTRRERVLAAAVEFSRPLLGASLATIVIHLPPVFLTGVTGEFFKALSLTVALSLILSFLIAWIAVPALSWQLLGSRDAEREDAGFLFRWLQSASGWALGALFRVRWVVPIFSVVWIALGVGAFQRLPSGFMPAMDEGGFVLDYFAAPGTSLSETDRLIGKVEKILQATPEVVSYSRRTGVQLGGGLTEANEGDFFVRLVPPPRRHIEDIMSGVREEIHRAVPGLRVELLQLMEDLIGDLTAVPQPIEVKLSATDSGQLDSEALRVAALLEGIPGVVDVNNGLSVAGDALELRFDQQRLAQLGLDPASAFDQAATLLSGKRIGAVVNQPKVTAIRLWTPESSRSTEDDLGRLRLALPDGRTVPLAELAAIERLPGQPTISREGLRETVSVTARTEGLDLGGAIARVRATLDAKGAMSEGVSYRLGGLFGEQQRAFRSLAFVFLAAIVLLFLLILFLYESFRVALLLTIAALMTMPAVAIGLFLTHTELNISSMMGFAMIVGAAAEIGVFYCSEVFARSGGAIGDRVALKAAALARLRPISMTSLAAILALLPLALGIGEGAAMLQPLAIAIISGLAVQVPIILGVLPVYLALSSRQASTG